MMKYLVFTIACLFTFSHAFSQNGSKGKVIESSSFQSELMGKTVNYSIYLPPDYETSNRKYPVVYLLHGYTDDDTGWLQFGEAPYIAD
jgi:S-formylglutathione hydrolase FrmB